MINICSICHGKYDGFGNNAQPINEGRCCNECNEKVVVPIRILRAINKDFEELNKKEDE